MALTCHCTTRSFPGSPTGRAPRLRVWKSAPLVTRPEVRGRSRVPGQAPGGSWAHAPVRPPVPLRPYCPPSRPAPTCAQPPPPLLLLCCSPGSARSRFRFPWRLRLQLPHSAATSRTCFARFPERGKIKSARESPLAGLCTRVPALQRWARAGPCNPLPDAGATAGRLAEMVPPTTDPPNFSKSPSARRMPALRTSAPGPTAE